MNMYFDPTLRTDAKPIETKADPFKLGTLIAWLEKQPADKPYCYLSCGECLLANYFTAHGLKRVSLGYNALHHSGGIRLLPPDFNDIAYYGTRTYGAALDRARALVQR
jgi:hypothetical protein